MIGTVYSLTAESTSEYAEDQQPVGVLLLLWISPFPGLQF